MGWLREAEERDIRETTWRDIRYYTYNNSAFYCEGWAWKKEKGWIWRILRSLMWQMRRNRTAKPRPSGEERWEKSTSSVTDQTRTLAHKRRYDIVRPHTSFHTQQMFNKNNLKSTWDGRLSVCLLFLLIRMLGLFMERCSTDKKNKVRRPYLSSKYNELLFPTLLFGWCQQGLRFLNPSPHTKRYSVFALMFDKSTINADVSHRLMNKLSFLVHIALKGNMLSKLSKLTVFIVKPCTFDTSVRWSLLRLTLKASVEQ